MPHADKFGLPLLWFDNLMKTAANALPIMSGLDTKFITSFT